MSWASTRGSANLRLGFYPGQRDAKFRTQHGTVARLLRRAQLRADPFHVQLGGFAFGTGVVARLGASQVVAQPRVHGL